MGSGSARMRQVDDHAVLALVISHQALRINQTTTIVRSGDEP